jgi:hypothetical protein
MKKTDDDDGVTKGGNRFTLSDENRLQDCLYDMIRKEYTSGASVIEDVEHPFLFHLSIPTSFLSAVSTELSFLGKE